MKETGRIEKETVTYCVRATWADIGYHNKY